MNPASPLLRIRDLVIEFAADRGTVRAVNGVSLDLAPGQTLGLVGESGSGKSVTGAAILRLIPSPPGRIVRGDIELEGKSLLSLPVEQMRRVRGARVGMVFQDPLSALNPVMTVGEQVLEALRAHGTDGPGARQRAVDALHAVGLPDPEAKLSTYPHELSGGMRQRVLIAMAIVLNPSLIIADEPTTALDVTIQAQLIVLLQRLKRERGMAMLLISHDLGVIAQLAERIAVMYAGYIVEEAPTETLFRSPRHPYTRGLLEAIPSQGRGGLPQAIPGNVPDPAAAPPGCPFHPRCPRAIPVCSIVFPPMTESPSGQRFACYNPEPA